VHLQPVDIIAGSRFANQDLFLLKALQVFSSFLVYTPIMYVYILWQINLCFGDMVKRIRIACGLFPGFPAVEYIIWPGSYLIFQSGPGPEGLEGFNDRHELLNFLMRGKNTPAG
jgi:hypothetical protein